MKKILTLTFILVLNLCAIAQIKSQADWQQRVDYTINVTLDDNSHFLNGIIEINYTNNSPETLDYIFIHLWPNGYKNNSTAFAKQMMQNGETEFYYAKAEERGYMDNIAFSSESSKLTQESTEHIDIIKVMLAEPLKSGQSVRLSTPFSVKIPKVFSRLGHKGQDYFITQWFPKPAVYDVNGWNEMPYLNMGEFYSEFGSFDVSITVPENYTVVATGECQTEGELKSFKKAPGENVISSKKTKTVRFTAEQVHDFAWFASKRWGYVSKKIKVGESEVLARVVAAEPNVSDLDHIQTAITYYSEHVGEYPYSHATVVHGELKAGGGMEYPMITLCDFMNEEVIVHEVGHNWFYGILANNERRYPWMDESINSFYEHEAMSKGSQLMGNANTLVMNSIVKDNLLRNEHQAIATSSEKLTNANYGMSVYGIGAQAFEYLKAYLGDELFKKCMQIYYNEWKFKHPLPDDMKRSWEKTSEKDLSWFFDDLLQADDKLDYAIKRKGDGFELKNKSSFEAPIPLEITNESKKEISWYSVPSGQTKLIPVLGDKADAVIDPNGRTLDLHVGNNSSKSNLKLKAFTGKDKPHIKEIYMVPTLGWNAYDRTMLGLGLHNYSISNKPFQYHILPMYSFENKVVNGVANMNYTLPSKGPSSYFQIGADVKSFTFSSRNPSLGGDEYRYIKAAPYMEYHLPKKAHRSLISRKFRAQIDFIDFDPRFDVDRGDTLSGSQFLEGARNFFTLTYTKENKRIINGYKLELMAEYGLINTLGVLADFDNPGYYDADSIRRFFPFLKDETTTEDLLRFSGVLDYNLDIGIKDKPLEFRVYGSIIANSAANSIYNNTIGSTDKAGYYDYRMEDYLLHRNAQQGLFQNQISNRRDFSKFVGPIILGNETWLTSINITVPIPGKIPVKPYIEFVIADGLADAFWNTNNSSIIYNAGLELELIKDRFEIFLNLAQSKDVTEYQEGLIYPNDVSSFAERITFVLDLNGLRPDKFKKNLKLF